MTLTRTHLNAFFKFLQWLGIFLVLMAGRSRAGTCGNGYTYERPITIYHLSFLSNLTDFPMPIHGTYAWAATVANGGGVQHTTTAANGATIPADLIFCDAISAGNPLAFEAESYTDTTGELVYWIKLPTASSTVDTVVYAFYGNAAVTTDQESAASVWSNGYVAVWHLATVGASTNLRDSVSGTVGTNHSTTVTAGQLDGGVNMVQGSGQYIDTGIAGAPLTTYTFETIMSGSATTAFFFSNANAGRTTGLGLINNPDHLDCFYRNSGAVERLASNALTAGLHTVACVHTSGTANMLMYFDGVTTGTLSGSPTDPAGTDNYVIGCDGTSHAACWSGKGDEIRLSSVARSSDWLVATHTVEMGAPYVVGPVIAPAAACGSGFLLSRKITTDHTLVGAADLTNFPLLVTGTFADLKTVANGGTIQHTTTGYTGFTIPADFQVCSGLTGGTILNYEFDTYKATTGAINLWVSIPTLSHTVDTSIYLFYNKASQTTSLENAPAVWSAANYISVYHMGDGTTLNLLDSGPAKNDMTAVGAIVGTGFIGGGAVGTARTPSGAILTPLGTAARTLEAWVYPTNLAATGPGCAAIYGSFGCSTFTCSPAGGAWAIEQSDGSGHGGTKIGVFDTPDSFAEGGNVNSGAVNDIPLTVNWFKVIGSSAAGNSAIGSAKLYVNGTLKTTTPTTGTIDAINTLSGKGIGIGDCFSDNGATSSFFLGNIDEVRVAIDDKAAAWNTFEYANDTGTTPTVNPASTTSAKARVWIMQ